MRKNIILKIRKDGFIFFLKKFLFNTFFTKKTSSLYPNIIQAIINQLNAKNYLEIGVAEGFCFFNIKASHKIAVDPHFLIPKRKRMLYSFKNRFYETTSDNFFKNHPKWLFRHGLDVIFIDGLHEYKQALRDILNSLEFLNKNGMIILHDCNPKEKIKTYPSMEHIMKLNLPKWVGWTGDVWKAIPYIRVTQKDLNVFVLDYDEGLGIITRGSPEKSLNYTLDEIKNLSYEDLENNRNKILNLKPLHYIFHFLKNYTE